MAETKVRVAHLIDDAAVGGVTAAVRMMLETPACGEGEVIIVNSHRPVAPRLPHDIIVFHGAGSWRKLPFLIALRLVNRRAGLIVHEHSYSPSFEALHVGSKGRFRSMLRTWHGLADLSIANSDAVGAWLTAIGVAPHRLRTIVPTTDLTALRAVPPVKPHKARPLVLGAVGRFAAQKGFDILIEAMRLLPPEIIRLQLGGFGPDEAALKTAAHGLPNIQFTGAVKDIAGFFSTCDVVVIPSRFEAYGLVCLEARAAARPVICSAVDGLVEQCGKHGTLVPARSPLALATAILSLYTEDLTSLGLQARASTAGHEDLFASRWQAALLDVMPRHQPSPRSALQGHG